jgi:hypothetical protein
MRSPLALLIRWFAQRPTARNPARVEAARWWRNGDHPGDNLGELIYDRGDDSTYRGDWIVTVDRQHYPVKPDTYAALTGRSELRSVPQ